ncbi:MAG: hypothetical protein A2X12_10785 [Bacteroidetes bacterium GWE2_29_8]|nr:MAG: hypothetical protein A2X12_10785 [Bacteroidetes bacterium GWE2_29_8]OFY17418.1 MAG: hypothetical protein A2X02_00790 [Bacteroidetes bacterium GWF2_29_10]
MKIKNSIAISNTGFIFNPVSGESFTTNQMGVEIINMLKAEMAYESIKDHIMDKYEVESTAFEKDYYDFVSLLKAYLVIELDK